MVQPKRTINWLLKACRLVRILWKPQVHWCYHLYFRYASGLLLKSVGNLQKTPINFYSQQCSSLLRNYPMQSISQSRPPSFFLFWGKLRLLTAQSVNWILIMLKHKVIWNVASSLRDKCWYYIFNQVVTRNYKKSCCPRLYQDRRITWG